MNQKDGYIDYLFGIPVFSGSEDSLRNEIEAQLDSRQGIGPHKGSMKILFTPNPEQIVHSWVDPDFKQILATADWNIPDGQGVVWALNRRHAAGAAKLHRIAGRQLFHQLLKLAKVKGYKVFLLGGRSGSGAAIVERFKDAGAGAFIQYDAGASDIKRETNAERERVLEAIAAFKPQLLFVAYGAPWQEKWIAANRMRLEKVGVRLAMAVGGSFEYEAGMVKAVPTWIETTHLEWLFRLLQEPWRWQRQLKGCMFFWKVITSSNTER